MGDIPIRDASRASSPPHHACRYNDHDHHDHHDAQACRRQSPGQKDDCAQNGQPPSYGPDGYSRACQPPQRASADGSFFYFRQRVWPAGQHG